MDSLVSYFAPRPVGWFRLDRSILHAVTTMPWGRPARLGVDLGCRAGQLCHGELGQIASVGSEPFVVLIGADCRDESEPEAWFEKIPTTRIRRLGLDVDTLERVIRPDLGPVALGET